MRRTLLRQEDPRLKLLRRMPSDSVCAEIGVWKGDFSRDILRVTAPRELHLIDPWAFFPEFPERKFGGRYAQAQADMDRVFEDVRARFARYPNVLLHRATSADALASFPGGFITGDDYTWGKKRGFPVEKAVADFLTALGLEDRLEVVGNQYIIERV
jgi:hypothetical protein